MKPKLHIPNLDMIYSNYSSIQNSISPFIDQGIFLSHRPPINRNYLMENFEYETDFNNELIAIGKGGYGKLYLAKNKKDKKDYAIKYVSKKKMQSMGVDFSVIKREIDIHLRITHPRIIKLYSYLEDRNNFYLAMEYASKGTLYQLIQRKKGMSENEAFHYFIQVASAIYFLHMNGYAHRDIKPENILLDENGGIKLCDFGWCVNVAKGERITFCGTYEYMAPEMINDEFYDMGIDIWSLGVLLYEIIHGYSPFRAHHFLKDAKSAMTEIFINIKNNNYTIDKDISEDCIDLIDKLLTIDTKKRIKIDELFLHPWVVSKENEYFPYYNRIKNNFNINNNYSNRTREKDITFKKSIDFSNYKKVEDNIYKQEYNQISVRNYEDKKTENNIEIEKKNNTIKYSRHFKNKSYCLVTNKSSSKNNGIYFIQGQSGYNKQEREEKFSKQEKEKDRNNYDYSNHILTEQNNNEASKIKKYERNALSPKILKKEYSKKNNFVYSINSNRKKVNNLPKVIRNNKKNIELKISKENKESKESKLFKTNPYDSQSQESNNINNNLSDNFKPKKTEEKKNISKNKNDKKSIIRVQRQDLDDYLKKQKEANELNLKMQKIKEQKEITIKKLKNIEEKKRREESLRKLYDSQKSSTSYDYYSKKNKSLKNQFSYINYIPKSEIGAYNLKPTKIENDNMRTKKNILYGEKNKEKRSKSFQQLINENILENKLKNLFKENSIKNKLKKNMCLNNDIYNFKIVHKDEEANNNHNFKRFCKKVIHLKKRNNYDTKTEGNLYKFNNTLDKNLIENKKFKSNMHQTHTHVKSNKSIQNIFYNTFYNCLFDNNQNNNILNNKNYLLYSNNIYDQKNNNYKRHKESKSISSEKNVFKNKNISKFTISKKDYNNNLNKENILVNCSTERKLDKFNKNKLQYDEYKTKVDKNKHNYIYLNYRNNLQNYHKIRSLSNNNNIII